MSQRVGSTNKVVTSRNRCGRDTDVLRHQQRRGSRVCSRRCALIGEVVGSTVGVSGGPRRTFKGGAGGHGMEEAAGSRQEGGFARERGLLLSPAVLAEGADPGSGGHREERKETEEGVRMRADDRRRGGVHA